MGTLSLNAASKYYGGHTALDEVTLELTEHAVTAVIGRSGCGKSTLLKLCNGLVRPDRGEVRLFDKPLDYGDLPRLRRRIGYAVQGTGLFPHLSAGDNITLLATLDGWRADRIERRLVTLLELCQLERSLLVRYPHQLSGGQQQRVGLCRALMLRPPLLLLDEPFAAIDPITRLDIHRQLELLQAAEPTTTVLVTHDMQEALRLAQQLVIMDAGRVIHSGSRSAILARCGSDSPHALLQSLLAGAAG
jgi:osmoprotectant transport system ATP-binding protein